MSITRVELRVGRALQSSMSSMMAMAVVALVPSSAYRAASPHRIVVPQMSVLSEDAAKAAWLSKLDAQSWNAQVHFMHEPLSFFALNNLAAKGTRRSQGGLVDIGEPEDFSRPLARDIDGCASVGSWACTIGGWDSPKLRPTTEVFLVLDGLGCVTDADGIPHPFGPGDVVVLPKQWHGR